FLFESTVLMALVGGSFGQLATRLRVVRTDGSGRPLSVLRALVRQVLVALVIPPLVFRPDGRGLHDMAVGSATVTLQTALRQLSLTRPSGTDGAPWPGERPPPDYRPDQGTRVAVQDVDPGIVRTEVEGEGEPVTVRGPYGRPTPVCDAAAEVVKEHLLLPVGT